MTYHGFRVGQTVYRLVGMPIERMTTPRVEARTVVACPFCKPEPGFVYLRSDNGGTIFCDTNKTVVRATVAEMEAPYRSALYEAINKAQQYLVSLQGRLEEVG